MIGFGVFLAVLVILIFVVTFSMSWFTVKQQTAAIIERLGKFNRVATAGLNVKLPYIEHVAKVVDLRISSTSRELKTRLAP